MAETVQSPIWGLPLTLQGIATQEFNTWLDQVSAAVNEFNDAIATLQNQVAELTVLTGTGSPESVVTANPGRLYVDTGAAAGTGIYFKETGTGNTGWVARS